MKNKKVSVKTGSETIIGKVEFESPNFIHVKDEKGEVHIIEKIGAIIKIIEVANTLVDILGLFWRKIKSIFK